MRSFPIVVGTGAVTYVNYLATQPSFDKKLWTIPLATGVTAYGITGLEKLIGVNLSGVALVALLSSLVIPIGGRPPAYATFQSIVDNIRR